jgi:hypothetical protein
MFRKIFARDIFLKKIFHSRWQFLGDNRIYSGNHTLLILHSSLHYRNHVRYCYQSFYLWFYISILSVTTREQWRLPCTNHGHTSDPRTTLRHFLIDLWLESILLRCLLNNHSFLTNKINVIQLWHITRTRPTVHCHFSVPLTNSPIVGPFSPFLHNSNSITNQFRIVYQSNKGKSMEMKSYKVFAAVYDSIPLLWLSIVHAMKGRFFFFLIATHTHNNQQENRGLFQSANTPFLGTNF